MIAEVIGGALANSLAIMTDAAHLLSDLLGFALSIFALYIGLNDPTQTLSYGYQRAEVIGALTSIILIWGLTLWLIYEAILRVIKRPPVDGTIMLITAVIGFFCNVIMMLTLQSKGMEHSHGIGGGHAEHGGHGGHGGHAAHGGGPGEHKAHGPEEKSGHGGHAHGTGPGEHSADSHGQGKPKKSGHAHGTGPG